eukprot:gene12120-14181_t
MQQLYSFIVTALLVSAAVASVDQLGAVGNLIPGYYTYAPDFRACPSPYCGGYYMSRVNAGEPKQYIAKFIFALDPRANTSLITATGWDNSVIVFGHTRESEERRQLVDFVVYDAFVALPLPYSEAGGSGRYYQLEDPRICTRSSCQSMYTQMLNSGEKSQIKSFRDPYTMKVGPFFDTKWYFNMLLNDDKTHRAIVQGSIGNDGLFNISRSFVRIPDPDKECPEVAKPKCVGRSVVVYTRDANRCLRPVGCTQSGVCPLIVPYCPEGYSLYSHPAGRHGCDEWYCDAEILEQSKVNRLTFWTGK